MQYNVELEIGGLMDGPPSAAFPTTPTDRLARLQQHQAAWAHLAWAPRTMAVSAERGPSWELASSVLGQSISQTPGKLDVRRIAFARLPRGTRGGDGAQGSALKEWTLGGFGFDVRDFTLDPEQDLLVLVCTPP